MQSVHLETTTPQYFSVSRLLDSALTLALSGRVGAAMESLFGALYAIKQCSTTALWRELCAESRRHPLFALLSQEPITGRAQQKPRGYAGDAVLLDSIYQHEDSSAAIQNASPLGRMLYQYTIERSSSLSVRWRREYLAQLIDATADHQPGAHILSVACGHLREAQLCSALSAGAIGRFVALDQDPESLAVVGQARSLFGVETCEASIKALLSGELQLGSFDLIYSAGLYDYLPLPVAQRLTKVLFSMIKSGGRLVIANFTPETIESAYMDALMDWSLLYRTDEEFAEVIAPTINSGALAKLFRDPFHNVVYAELIKVAR